MKIMEAQYPLTNAPHDETPDPLYEHVQDPGDPDGVVAAEKQRAWRANRPVTAPREVPQDRLSRRWPRVVATVLLLAGLLVGSYYLGYQKARVPVAKQQKVAQDKTERKETPVTTATKRYDSSTFGLSLTYPDNWIVADTADQLTVTSPTFSLTEADGTADGHVVVSVRKQQSSIPGFPGTATAGLASTQLTYKRPSPIQRTQTYLSFVDYQGAGSVSALFLTGDRTYQPGEAVPMTDLAQRNPLVSVTFVECSKSYCTGGKTTPASITAASWDKATFKAAVVTMLQSLVFN